MTTILEIDHLYVEARAPDEGWYQTVHDVSLKVGEGEVVALIGESGAGKTTVALAALGYARPGTRFTSGSVRLGAFGDVLKLGMRERQALRGRRVAYVAQSAAAALNPARTIGDQLSEVRRIHGLDESDPAFPPIFDLMARLNLPDPELLARRYPHQLSGGQQQRAMIAMALAGSPDLLILDEPTTALDVTTQIDVLAALKDVLRSGGKAAVYVSHNLAVVAQVADRILVMKSGLVVEQGSAQQILETPRQPYTRALLDALRPHPGAARRHASRVTPEPLLLSIRDMRASYRRRGFFAPPEPAEQHILRGVNLDIRQGEVVALVGESGSGKSTLARIIAGLHQPLTGAMRLTGHPLSTRARQRNIEQLRSVQLVTQSPDASLNPSHPVAEVIGRPLQLYFGMRGREARRRVDELLSLVDLSPTYADRMSIELSGGEKQRVSIARALAARPELLLCDEVLSSLDTVVAASVLKLMADLRERLRLSYLFISHDLATVSAIADRVVVLYAGKICEEGPIGRVFARPQHPYTTLLLSSMPEPRRGWLDDLLSEPGRLGVRTGGAAPRDQGCSFRDRCPLSIEAVCDRVPLPARDDAGDHTIFCHRSLAELAPDRLSSTRAGSGAPAGLQKVGA